MCRTQLTVNTSSPTFLWKPRLYYQDEQVASRRGSTFLGRARVNPQTTVCLSHPFISALISQEQTKGNGRMWWCSREALFTALPEHSCSRSCLLLCPETSPSVSQTETPCVNQISPQACVCATPKVRTVLPDHRSSCFPLERAR